MEIPVAVTRPVLAVMVRATQGITVLPNSRDEGALNAFAPPPIFHLESPIYERVFPRIAHVSRLANTYWSVHLLTTLSVVSEPLSSAL